ncbi:MAG: class I lanthipeptide [Thermoanaerobaculia bacterium]
MKKLAKKLTLHRETVRLLEAGEMSRALGGNKTNEPFCESNAVTCEGQNCPGTT